APQIQSILRPVGRQVADVDIADHRSKLPGFSFFVEEIDREPGQGNFSDLDVPHVNVLQEAAAHGVVLDADRVIQVRTVHLAIFSVHVANAAGNLATDGNASVPVLHAATLDNDVL